MGDTKALAASLGEAVHPVGGAARDLIDFHLRWKEFRPAAQALLARPGLGGAESDCLYWLIALADRIGAEDITFIPRSGPGSGSGSGSGPAQT
jgi:hypothetical protein